MIRDKQANEAMIKSLSDEALLAAPANVQKHLKMAIAMDVVDIQTSRYDSSYLADDTLDKNFDKIAGLSFLLKDLQEEIKKRGLS